MDSVELAGEGALLKLLEERRRKLAAEGLFDEGRKRPLPSLPDVIGVVTSPTGAVIRDILHRLEDRFPRHVLIWPVPVQGDGAGDKIADAITGFNALPAHGTAPRPDLLIVARGGGSLEDLWEFNQEAVVRAAAASEIPLISAVGHETDTTLIDFAADHRAPTPTAAAERAVPVRAELHARTLENEQRMRTGMERVLMERRTRLEGMARGLPWPTNLLERAMQSLDHATEQLVSAMRRRLDSATSSVSIAGAGLRSPQDVVDTARREISGLGGRLAGAMSVNLQQRTLRLEGLRSDERMKVCFANLTTLVGGRLSALGDRLEDLSSQRILERGFAMIEDRTGSVISSSTETRPGQQVSIRFSDGQVPAKVGGQRPKRSRIHPGQGSFL